MRGRKRWGILLAALTMTAVMVTGCSSSPDTLAGTAWKITGLKTPEGTEYDEAAYDAIIGATIYRFGENGWMSCAVGEEAADEDTYTYAYEKGELKISWEGAECSGTVKKHRMQLKLGEQGTAVLTEQTS